MDDVINFSSILECKAEEKYRNILRKIMVKISMESKKRKYYTIIEIPMNIISIADYDFKLSLVYIMKYLKMNNLIVKYHYPNILIVYWKHMIEHRKTYFTKMEQLIPKKEKYNIKTSVNENMKEMMKDACTRKKIVYDKDLDILDSLFD
jgi:hypothetical protein